jgi:hypothetical protein
MERKIMLQPSINRLTNVSIIRAPKFDCRTAEMRNYALLKYQHSLDPDPAGA